MPNIIHKTKLLTQLTVLLQNNLDPSLAPHCTVANFRDQCLIVAIDNPIWVTSFRYRSHELINKLQTLQEFSNLQKIAYCICPPNLDLPSKVKNKIKLAEENALLLEQTATFVSSPTLQTALLRLTKHAKK